MKSSLLKCLKSFRFAWKGFAYVFLNENNMRYHILAAIIVVLLGGYLKFSLFEWIVIVFCIGLVWAAEIFNTAIEKLVDLVSPEQNPKAGLIKDIASGAVLVTAMMALAIGVIIVTSKFH